MCSFKASSGGSYRPPGEQEMIWLMLVGVTVLAYLIGAIPVGALSQD